MEVEIRGNRKSKVGTVVSNKMERTVIVQVQRTMRHPKYAKVVTRSKKFYAHSDHEPRLEVGTIVEIVETRPLSKLKRWRVISVPSQAISSPA